MKEVEMICFLLAKFCHIRGIQLPFTPGVGNQQFNISAYSDESYELLEEL